MTNFKLKRGNFSGNLELLKTSLTEVTLQPLAIKDHYCKIYFYSKKPHQTARTLGTVCYHIDCTLTNVYAYI